MYELDEKLMSDKRAIVAISKTRGAAEPNLKPGMLNFEHEFKDLYYVPTKGQHNRLIHVDEVTGKIPYDLNFAGTITIDKDLVVLGDVTNLETKDLIVSDNIIELNKDETGSGIGKGQAGIEINRGTKDHAFILFSEISDRPTLAGFNWAIADTNLFWIYENGDISTTGDFYTKNLFVDGNADIKQNLTVEGNSVLEGTLTVEQPATFRDTVNIQGAATLDSTLTVTDATLLKSTLTVDGETTLNNILTAVENATFQKDVTVLGNTTLEQTLSVNGDTTLEGTLDVTGTTTLHDTLDVTGTVEIHDVLTADDDVYVGGDLTVNGSTNFSGKLSTSEITNTGLITTKDLSVTNNATIQELTVNGDSVFNQDVTMNQTLTVEDAATINGTLTVPNDLTTLHSLVVNTFSTFKGNVTAQSDVQLEKTLTVDEKATFNGLGEFTSGIVVERGARFTDELTAEQITASGEVNLLNDVNIGGDLTVSGTVNVDSYKADNITFKNESDSGLTWIYTQSQGLRYRITGLATNYNTMSLFDTVENDYNIVFMNEKATGKNRGWLFATDTTPLFHIGEASVRSANDIYVQRNTKWSPLLAKSDSHKAAHSIGGHDEILPSDIGAVKNGGSTSILITGVEANKPAASEVGRLYFATDTKRILQDIGTDWQIIGGQDTMDWVNITNKPATYTPPIATSTTLGGIKIGSGLIADPDGTIHVPEVSIQYVIHIQEETVAAPKSQFTLDKVYVKGCNHVIPYIYGRRVPPSGFEETSDNVITFKEPIPAGAHVMFQIYLIPNDVLFKNHVQEYITVADQVDFNLTIGKYTVGTNKLKVYLNGTLLPPSAYIETSPTSFQLKAAPGAGYHIMAEYIYDPIA